jgi:hypothetical protein
MSQTPDDEEEKDIGAVTRKAWFAGHLDAADSEGGFGSGFRGVPGVRHGGSKTVTRDQISGSMDLCWCGQPFDHDWAGKSDGRSHPRVEDPYKGAEVSPTTQPAPTEEQPRIERRALRAYNADLADMVLTAVNEYHVKYRITAHSVILFPPDGTQPYAVNARNGDRQVKAARAWFVRHCIPEDLSIKQAAKPAPSTKPVDTDAIRELAETIDSEEHLPKLEEPAKAEKPEKPVKPAMAAEKAAPAPAQPEPATPQPDSKGWVPYLLDQGKPHQKTHPFYLFNTKTGQVKCTIDGEILAGTRSTGGHTRTHHTDTTTLWGAKAKEKGIQTYFTNKARGQVEEAIGLLHTAMGIQPKGDDAELIAERDKLASEKTVLQTESKQLKDANKQLTDELAALKTKFADMEAKVALAREAFGL